MAGDGCRWPAGHCQCAAQVQSRPDPFGRVAMHCETGLALNKASMSRFMLFCLSNNVEVYQISAFNPRYRNSLVTAALKIRPDQVAEFEFATGGKLRLPPKIKVNKSTTRT